MKIIMIEGESYFKDHFPTSSMVIHVSWKDLAGCQLRIDHHSSLLRIKGQEIYFNQHVLLCIFSRKNFHTCYLKNANKYYQNSGWSAVIHYLGLHYPTINPIHPSNYTFSDAFYWTLWDRAKYLGIKVPSWSYRINKDYPLNMPTTLISMGNDLGQFEVENLIKTFTFEVIANQFYWEKEEHSALLNSETLQKCLDLMKSYLWKMCSITFGYSGKEWLLFSMQPTLYHQSQRSDKAKAIVNCLQKPHSMYIPSKLRPKLY